MKNQRSALACAAIDTVKDLHFYLGKAMDAEAQRTGGTLLKKFAQTTNVFIHQKANLALDALVKGCSPGRVLKALLSTGLRYEERI